MRAMLLGLVRMALGALFAYAAFTKVGDMGLLAEEVANYQLLPSVLVPLVAVMLPGVEILVGLLLVVGLLSRPAALVTATMLLAFIVGLSQALLRGIDLRCGCFGGADAATWGTVLRDVVMLAAAVSVLWAGPGRLALSRRWPRWA